MARAGRWHRRAPESGRRHQGREQPAPHTVNTPGRDRAAHPAAGLRRTRTAPEPAADLTTSCFPHRARGPGRPAQEQRRAPSSPEEGRQQPPPPAAHPPLHARRAAPGHGDPGTGLPPAGSAPDAWTRTRSPLPARGGRPRREPRRAVLAGATSPRATRCAGTRPARAGTDEAPAPAPAPAPERRGSGGSGGSGALRRDAGQMTPAPARPVVVAGRDKVQPAPHRSGTGAGASGWKADTKVSWSH